MGVQVETITPGDNVNYPKTGQRCVVHYTGFLLDGSTFDCSRKRGSTFEFVIGRGQVIRGWDEGVGKMSLGERAKLTCSPDYAYGSDGCPPRIPSNSTLIFDVELKQIK